jgi:hypothetical protein
VVLMAFTKATTISAAPFGNTSGFTFRPTSGCRFEATRRRHSLLLALIVCACREGSDEELAAYLSRRPSR